MITVALKQNGAPAARRRPAGILLLPAALLASWAVAPAHSQERARVPGRARVVRPQQGPRPLADQPDPRARQAIQLFLQKGVRQPYEGEQISRLLQPGGRVMETRQQVRYLGPQRVRMDYLAPADVQGEVILITNGRFFHYKPNQKVIQEGVAPVEEFLNRSNKLIEGVRNRQIQVSYVGQELVAGRMASIVELRSTVPGGFFLKFWVDQETGVRLKFQHLDPQGRAVSETYFTSIKQDNPVLADADFRPGVLPNVPHEPLLPDVPPLANVDEAQKRVGYRVKVPDTPPGYKQTGVWVVPGPGMRQTTIIRFSDGVNTFALFETPAPQAKDQPLVVPRERNGVAHWNWQGISYALVGNIRHEWVKIIFDSIHR